MGNLLKSLTLNLFATAFWFLFLCLGIVASDHYHHLGSFCIFWVVFLVLYTILSPAFREE